MSATYRSRLPWRDALATGTIGLRSRRGRTLLTAIGIAIGIASMVAVLGISASSKADLIERIDRLGTNLLVVEAGETLDGKAARLPTESAGMVRRIAPVEQAASLSRLSTPVERNPYVDSGNGIAVFATEPELADAVAATARTGRLLDDRTAALPTVVLGSVAAERLGLRDLSGGHDRGQAVRDHRHQAASLSALGGLIGIALGSAVTLWYASSQGWRVDIPLEGLGLGVAAALLLGALAGLYPAVRAARLDPAEAIRPG